MKVTIQINEFILGQGRVSKLETVSEKEAKRQCEYRNVFRIKKH